MIHYKKINAVLVGGGGGGYLVLVGGWVSVSGGYLEFVGYILLGLKKHRVFERKMVM